MSLRAAASPPTALPADVPADRAAGRGRARGAQSRHPRLGQLAIALVVVVQLGWTLAVLARFVGPMPPEEASQWARTHVRPGEGCCSPAARLLESRPSIA